MLMFLTPPHYCVFFVLRPWPQVARCTKIINAGQEDAKYVINVRQIAKFVVGLGEKVSRCCAVLLIRMFLVERKSRKGGGGARSISSVAAGVPGVWRRADCAEERVWSAWCVIFSTC